MAFAADVSIRDQIVPVSAGQCVFDMLRTIGVQSVEALVDVNCYLPYLRCGDETAFSLRDATAISKLKERLAREGVRMSALLIATDFSADDAEHHVNWAVDVVNAASELGTPVVRIDPWTIRRTLPTATIRDNFVKCVRQVLDRTTDSGVDLGMENHGHLFNDPAVLDDVLETVPDSRFGLTLDTGNFYWWGHPAQTVYQLIDRYASRSKHTHVKNIHYPPNLAEQHREIGYEYKQFCSPLYEGNLDLKRIVQILRAAGYARDFCVEDESLFKVPEADRVGVLRKDVDSLRLAMK